MFSKLALFAAVAASFKLAVFIVALPSPSGIVNSCNHGQVYCCDSVQPAVSSVAQKAVGLAEILIPISDTVGLTCSPISALSLQGQSCTTQPTCCTGSDFNGAVVVGCRPINGNAGNV